MNTTIYKSICGSLLCLMSLAACDDLMDTHLPYIEGGEIVYAPKPDTIYVKSGKNRVQLNYEISKSPNIKEIEVSWNNGENVERFPVELKDGAAKGYVYIEELPERSYTFKAQLVDIHGNYSLPLTGFGRSYGENYKETLRKRDIIAMRASDEGGIIEWSPAPNGLVYNEVTYENAEGKQQTVQSEAASDRLVLSDFKTGSSVSYRSVYLPEENCVDRFYTEWTDSEDEGFTFPHLYLCTEEGIDRNAWEVLLCESVREGDGQGVPGMLDGDRNTYWHSGYDDGRVDCPFELIFDMQQPLWIGRIGVMQRNGGYNFRLTDISFYTTTDEAYAGDKNGNRWSLLTKVSCGASDDMQWFDVPEEVLEQAVKGRFLKMVITDTYDHNGICAMAELTVQQVASVDGTPVR